ncbi:MAG: Chain length determinant protein [Chloroflexi bacterium ADurb.Bin325]|nr:MAG: Chain length determinant protein [Chloroflexi bacterium ADurb.Bin325]
MMETSVWTYLAVLRKRLWLILLLFAVTMVVILVRAWRMPPAYASSTVLQVMPLESEEVTLFARQNTVSSADAIAQIVFQFTNVVRSAGIAQRTLSETGIRITARQLLDGLAVERDPSGDIITVSATAGTPEDAERILVKQVELALQQYRESRARPAAAAGRFLEAELDAAERELENARAGLLRFKLDTGFEYLDREIVAEQDAIRQLSAAREQANIEVQRLEAVVRELRSQRDAAEAAGLQARVDALEAQIAERGVEIAGQRQRAAASFSLLAEHQTNLTSLITLTGQAQQLQDLVQEKQNSRDFLADKVREARLKQSQSENVGYLQVIQPPTTPQSQVSTRTVQVALLGGGLSLVAGGLLAFLLEFIEQMLRSAPRGRSRGPA